MKLTSVSPRGTLRIIPAYPRAAWEVLNNLSRVEVEERARLGLDASYGATFKEVEERRAFLLISHIRPWELYAVFGVTEVGAIWFLPTQEFVDKHPRELADPSNIQWVIDFCYDFAEDVGIPCNILFNGVTPENRTVMNWLRRAANARFFSAVPSETNGAELHPFVLARSPTHV